MTQSYTHLITDISRCCRTYALTGFLLIAATMPAMAAQTFHVRTDGGSAKECTGLSDAAYSGTGTKQNCAFASLMVALPPGLKPLIAGGDTIVVHPGEYKMGMGSRGTIAKDTASGADLSACNAAWPYECTMSPLPSGPDAANPTRIIGGDGSGTCGKAKPKLIGVQRTAQVLNLGSTKNAEVSCLEITDNSTCILAHTGGLACIRDKYPMGEYADRGILATDTANLKLSNLDIHGLASNGITAGRMNNLTVDNVRIAFNGWAGFEGDVNSMPIVGTQTYPGKSANTGTMKFTRLLVEYNGCSNTLGTKTPIGCWGQFASGYGDGFGTGQTGGDWAFEDSVFRYNTSDGLDLLYHELGGTVTVNRVKARGNASNQIKIAGSATVKNSMIQGNCGFFRGKPFVYTYTYYDTYQKKNVSGQSVDDCRAVGDALVFNARTATDDISAVNNTILGEGNTIITIGGADKSKLKMVNNILIGLPYFLYPSYNTADSYVQEPDRSTGKPVITLDETGTIKQDLRNTLNCTAASKKIICGNAGLVTATNSVMNPRLVPGSAARDSGITRAENALVPTDDLFGSVRPATNVDRGAVEMTQ